MAKEKEEVVFKDIKKSLTIGQFNTIVEVFEEEYKRLKNASKSRDSFEEKARKRFEQEVQDMPNGFAEKLIEGLMRKASKEFDRVFKEELRRHENVVDFLNTFRTSDNQLERLDQYNN